MEIDTSNLTPAEEGQARMFATMVSQMPTEAVRFLRDLLDQELASRD